MQSKPAAIHPKLISALNFAQDQVKHLTDAHPDDFPI